MARALLCFLAGASLVLTVACAEEKVRPPLGDPGLADTDRPVGGGGGEGGVDGGSTPDGATIDGGLCHDLPVTGVLVDRTNALGSAPAATGGTIADGVYDLVDANIYTGAGGAGPTGVQVRESLEISGATLEVVSVVAGKETRKTYSFSTSAGSMSVTETCPSSAPSQLWQYSVSGSQLTLFSTLAVGQTAENVYTQR